MTKAQAIYEICELAGSVIHAAAGPDAPPPELFQWCDALQVEAVKVKGTAGTPWSKDFKRANDWLTGLIHNQSRSNLDGGMIDHI